MNTVQFNSNKTFFMLNAHISMYRENYPSKEESDPAHGVMYVL